MDVTHTEVAVLGGGIEGCAVAYYTARLGYKVTVVERGELACGTSSHCDGNILVIDKEPGFDSRMTFTSQQLIDQLAKELPLDFEYRRPGSMHRIRRSALIAWRTLCLKAPDSTAPNS
jgi:sarcosine oxidase subunit beta